VDLKGQTGDASVPPPEGIYRQALLIGTFQEYPIMSDTLGTLVVLRPKAHGIDGDVYAEALRERIEAFDVVYARTPHEQREAIRTAEVATGQGITEEMVERAENLQLFAAASAGIGYLPLDALAASGVTVTNASGVHAPEAAEHVLDQVLTLLRRSIRGWERQRERTWEHYQPFGTLAGRTATVVGLGAIGQSITERLHAFDVETTGVRYTPGKGGPTDEVIGFDEEAFHESLSRTDVLILCCPLTDRTRGLVGEAELQVLPTDAVLANVARGPVVDTDALVHALRSNRIHGAALDVTDPEPLPRKHPLWDFEDVLVTPHIAGYTPEYWTRLASLLARNTDRIRERGSYTGLENQVRPVPGSNDDP